MRQASGPAQRLSLLWIDDEVTPADATVRLLGDEGLEVDCVQTGADGLVRAKIKSYDAILLDLRLPDVPGLSVLDALLADGLAGPITVLTGYGDVTSAVAAMRLGAADYRTKPLLADELARAIRSTIVPRFAWGQTPTGPSLACSAREGHLADKSVSVLLSSLKAFVYSQYSGISPEKWADAPEALQPSRYPFVSLLLEALLTKPLPAVTFLAVANVLGRHILLLRGQQRLREIAHASELLRRLAEQRRPPPGPVVQLARGRLDECIRRHVRPSETDLSKGIGVHRAHLGRLILSQTGLRFREWRRAVFMQHAIANVAQSTLQIAQIAYNMGYDHPSQFNKEFRDVFGVAPSDFRRVAQSYLSPL